MTQEEIEHQIKIRESACNRLRHARKDLEQQIENITNELIMRESEIDKLNDQLSDNLNQIK